MQGLERFRPLVGYQSCKIAENCHELLQSLVSPITSDIPEVTYCLINHLNAQRQREICVSIVERSQSMQDATKAALSKNVIEKSWSR